MKKDKMPVIVYGAKKQTLKITLMKRNLQWCKSGRKRISRNEKKEMNRREMNVGYPYEAKIHIAIFYMLEKS